MKTIGVADTTFARVDLFPIVEQAIRSSKYADQVKIVRYTVPGIKDLPVACKILLEQKGCDIAIALGWMGGAAIDLQCGHEASQGLIQAQLMAGKHVLGVFVLEQEEKNPEKLKHLAFERARKHALNALYLLFEPQTLAQSAGKGWRQGAEDAGGLE